MRQEALACWPREGGVQQARVVFAGGTTAGQGGQLSPGQFPYPGVGCGGKQKMIGMALRHNNRITVQGLDSVGWDDHLAQFSKVGQP